MSRACKCDRCGTFFTLDQRTYENDYDMALILYNNTVDLCLSCQKDLKNWWNRGIEESSTKKGGVDCEPIQMRNL